MTSAKEAQVFRRFFAKMLNGMQTSKPVLIATASQLYSEGLISQVCKYLRFIGYKYLICIDNKSMIYN